MLIGIFVFAFFKFHWSLRQLTHADAVCLGADAGGEGCAGPGRFRAAIDAGAMLVTHGVASFNRGLRAYFFGLAALAWFLQPWALVLATSWVVGCSTGATVARGRWPRWPGPRRGRGCPEARVNALHAKRLDTRLRRNDDAKLVRALGEGCR